MAILTIRAEMPGRLTNGDPRFNVVIRRKSATSSMFRLAKGSVRAPVIVPEALSDMIRLSVRFDGAVHIARHSFDPQNLQWTASGA